MAAHWDEQKALALGIISITLSMLGQNQWEGQWAGVWRQMGEQTGTVKSLILQKKDLAEKISSVHG